MKICKSLFHEINFVNNAIQPCCNVFGYGVPRFPFNGGYVDMERYARHIDEVLSKLQKGTTDFCGKCSFLKDKSFFCRDNLLNLFSRAYSFKYISINHHENFCNCKCIYCNLWKCKGSGEPYTILESIKSLFEQKVIDKKASFHWGGGESSILKDFALTCDWILENGHKQYVHTNALKYSPAMGNFLSANMGAVNISLDSSNAAIYEQVKGVDGFGLVVNNIKKYLSDSYNFNQVHIKYIIFEANNSIQHIEEFFNLMHGLGICRVEFSFDFRDVRNNSISEKSILAAVHFKKLAQQYGMECISFFTPQNIMERIRLYEEKG